VSPTDISAVGRVIPNLKKREVVIFFEGPYESFTRYSRVRGKAIKATEGCDGRKKYPLLENRGWGERNSRRVGRCSPEVGKSEARGDCCRLHGADEKGLEQGLGCHRHQLHWSSFYDGTWAVLKPHSFRREHRQRRKPRFNVTTFREITNQVALCFKASEGLLEEGSGLHKENRT